MIYRYANVIQSLLFKETTSDSVCLHKGIGKEIVTNCAVTDFLIRVETGKLEVFNVYKCIYKKKKNHICIPESISLPVFFVYVENGERDMLEENGLGWRRDT